MVEMGKRHTLLFDALQRKDWKMSGEQLARIQNSAQSIASNTPLKPLALEFIEQTRYLQRVIETGKKHESKKAFSQLTEGCNHCHVGANMGFAVVRIPDEKTDN